MWSSNCLPTVSFSLEFETVTAVGLQSSTDAFLYLSPSPCVSHSGYWCPTLWISLVTVLVSWFPLMCLPLWLMVSGSPDASPHWSLFTCLPVWFSTAGGVPLSRCLSSLVSLHVFPALASGVSILGGGVRLSGCLSFRVFLHVSLTSGVRLFGCLLFASTGLP